MMTDREYNEPLMARLLDDGLLAALQVAVDAPVQLIMDHDYGFTQHEEGSYMNINDLTITSLEAINVFDAATGAYLFTLDELQNDCSDSEELDCFLHSIKINDLGGG